MSDNLSTFTALTSLMGDHAFNYTSENASTLHDSLSASHHMDMLNSMYALLSGFIDHRTPWESLKHNVLGPDFEPLALSSINLPENFNLNDHVDVINKSSADTQQHIIDTINDTSSPLDIHNLHNVHFTVLSGDDRVYCKDKHGEYLRFVDFIVNLDTNNLGNHVDFAKKVVYHFASIFKD